MASRNVRKRQAVFGAITGLILAACSEQDSEEVHGTQILDVDGVKIHFLDEGQGEPVVLLHGFTESAAGWREVPAYEDLSKAGYRLIAMDIRGHGTSDKPHEPEAYGIELTQDVVRLLDFLEIDRAHVIGYSMGADIAFKLIELYPERLATVVLGGFGGDPTGGWTASNFDLLELAAALERGDGLRPLLREPYSIGVPPLSEGEIEAVNEEWMSGQDALALAAAIRSFSDLAVPIEVVMRNRVPALIIDGELDPERVESESLRDLMGQLKYVVVPSGEHETVRDRPEFSEEIVPFLASHSVSAP